MLFKSLVSGTAVYPGSYVIPDSKKTVCITGHREKSIPSYRDNPVFREMTLSAVRLMLCRYIDMAVECGYENFISGLAVGTDLWAARYIISKRKINSRIRLFGAMPYLRHAERFPSNYRKILAEVEKEADFLVTVNSNPDIIYGSPSSGANFSKDLYRDRNYYMVDNSSAVIAFLNKESVISGTAQTVNYANRTGRKVCRFGVEDVFDIIDKTGTDIKEIGREIAFLDNVFEITY